MDKHYIYIIKSLSDGSFYIGYSADIDRRLTEHNSGKSLYTRRKMPWRLVYFEVFATKSEALKREKFLKAQRNHLFYEQLIIGKK